MTDVGRNPPRPPAAPRRSLVSWRSVAVALGLCAIDGYFIGQGQSDRAAMTTAAYLLLAVGLVGAATMVVELTIRAAARKLEPHPPWVGVLVGAIGALGPAIWFAAVLTEGAGIQRSGYAGLVATVVAVGLTGSAAIAGGLGPWVATRPVIRRAVGVTLLVLAVVLLAATSIQPIQYIRPHRGLLVMAGLCGLGALWALAPRAAPRGAWAVVTVVGAVGIGAGLISISGSGDRGLALHRCFERTLVVQKLQAGLVRLFPDHPTAIASDDAVRAVVGASPPKSAAPLFPGHDVLLFTGDTLRADRFFGPRAQQVTPHLERWRAFRFVRAATNFTYTDHAVPALLSGDWAFRRAAQVDPEGRWTRVFGRAGYHRIAVLPARPHFRHARGFDRREDWTEDCLAGLTNLRAALDDAPKDKPLMLWMHSIDAHVPHRFRPEDKKFGIDTAGTYDAAVHLFDRCFDEFRSLLRSYDRWERSVVVVSSDHGEALGEHGRSLLHGSCYLHDVHIPLFVRLPEGGPDPRQVDYWAMTIDILPTVAALVGLDVTDEPMQGRDLSSTFERAFDGGKGWALSWGDHCASLITGDHHLVHDARGGHYQLFDVVEDPAETETLSASRPETLRRMLPVLDRYAR